GGEVGRTNAVARLPREELFDDPVLERMERDHDDPAAGTDDAHGGGESALEIRKLVVDRDAKSLEDTRRGIDAARPPRLDAGNETVRAGHVVEKREVRSCEDRAVTEARELARGEAERGGIAIEPEEPAARRGCIEDGGGVPAGTDRPVEIATAFARSKLGEYLGHENRLMSSLDPIAKFRGPGDRSRRRSGLGRARRA